MKITYTAPNISHHYPYAEAFRRAELLHAFVSGFPRFGKKQANPELNAFIKRRDILQLLYLGLGRIRFLPNEINRELAYLSKVYLDRSSFTFASKSDIFLHYNGAGLYTSQRLENCGVLRVCEVVNCHIEKQAEILKDEFRRCGLPYKGELQREVRRRVAEYECADAILGPSSFVLESFRERGFPEKKLLKNPFGFTLPACIGTASHESDNRFRILYVGSISVRKGIRYLIEAFAAFDHPRKELHLVGPSQAFTGIENISVPKGVKFHGILKHDALARAYTSADVFVLPSIEEGMALVLGEALAFGLPIIATRNTGATDLITPGLDGIIVPIRDPAAIASELTRLADDPDFRQNMGNAALERARRLGGWSESGQNLVNLLTGFYHSKSFA